MLFTYFNGGNEAIIFETNDPRVYNNGDRKWYGIGVDDQISGSGAGVRFGYCNILIYLQIII